MVSGRLGVAIVIVLAVIANNVIYMQDIWFGQGYISLDSWKPYIGILVCFVVVVAGLAMLLRPTGSGKAN